jgi:hypothetical protein
VDLSQLIADLIHRFFLATEFDVGIEYLQDSHKFFPFIIDPLQFILCGTLHPRILLLN